VVTGMFVGSGIDLGDGVSRTSPGNGVEAATFVMKLHADGSTAWVSAAASQGSSAMDGYGVTALADGSAIVAGYFQGAGMNLGDGTQRTSPDGGSRWAAYVRKVNADGTAAWARTSDAPTGFSSALAEDVRALPDGRFALVGSFTGTNVDLGDGVPRTSPDSGNAQAAYIQMRRADGTVVWTTVTSAPGTSHVAATGVDVFTDGRMLVSGYFSGSGVDLGDGVARTSGASGVRLSAFALGLSADGANAWTVATTAGGGTPRANFTDVAALPNGNAMVTGTFNGAGVDLGDGVSRTSPNNGAAPSYLTRLIGDADSSPGDSTGPGSGGGAAAQQPGGASAPAPAASPSTAPALSVSVLALRRRLISGQVTRVVIRTRNTGSATAAGVRACIRLPRNLTISRKGSATRSGREFCFAVGDVAPGATVDRAIVVRAVSSRVITQRVLGGSRFTGGAAASAAAPPVVVRIRPGGTS